MNRPTGHAIIQKFVKFTLTTKPQSVSTEIVDCILNLDSACNKSHKLNAIAKVHEGKRNILDGLNKSKNDLFIMK